MTSTPKSTADESLNDSWIEVNYGSGEEAQSNSRNTPVSFVGSMYNGSVEKLLLEAQRESNHSSAVGSAISSYRDSPKSPHSPVNEPACSDAFIINKVDILNRDRHVSTDWIWDWSSRPDQAPPKIWKFKHPQRTTLSLRNSKAVKQGLFSSEVLSILFLTNLLSLLLGAGFGLYIGKRINSVSNIALN
ncbi:BCL2/adenovirus E1B 19 kDa protein-interacting protein 3 isoform X1 [Centruroides vittatus]|uniref:BCL2/adenovirus E1B 19 kDa protein-interacting protein 3 isoform X1 n=1 Tax=Centruroides vittatus TaxID=120091 RepID=UPI00351086BB